MPNGGYCRTIWEKTGEGNDWREQEKINILQNEEDLGKIRDFCKKKIYSEKHWWGIYPQIPGRYYGERAKKNSRQKIPEKSGSTAGSDQPYERIAGTKNPGLGEQDLLWKTALFVLQKTRKLGYRSPAANAEE